MILLQLSSGQGPAECGRAVNLAYSKIVKECKAEGIELTVVECVPDQHINCLKSLLLEFRSTGVERAKPLAQKWEGVMLWVCQSPFRPKHKRKNWFFSGQVYEFNQADEDRGITYQACRASGAGGQHINTTDSAIRATHSASGISVRVESERSQHANKRLATALIYQKLEEFRQSRMSEQEKAHWQQHQELQRGNPLRTFKGDKFISVR
ncbi:peptide chain release factor H [Amphritea pacifica]|uniref:Peptide chain release factor H n=1 Tax=Amphritea pacifica TaxID=2811233 RepID=A0ABS2W7J3_9GAMM|nr:peptide chain release factor H [Amphritea pacifica]MBN0987653.1 peptide chain release factor H [Amphritea pacifica]